VTGCSERGGGGTCAGVGYCSPACRQRHEAAHRVEHKVVRQASNIAAQSHADITLIKLAVRIIAMRSLNRGKREQFDKQVMNLMGHEERCPLEWVDSVTRAAKLIMPLLPKDARLSTRDFVGICSRINTNSHRMHYLILPQCILGVGLFPLASLINHSCHPNCAFHNQGQTLYVRTLCDVKQGEELCYSYIDLYQSRSKRQAELLSSKFFECQCERCSAPLAASVVAPTHRFNPTLEPLSQFVLGVRMVFYVDSSALT